MANYTIIVKQPYAIETPVRKAIITTAPNAYVLPVLSEGVHHPAGRRGDSLRLELSSVEIHSLVAVGTLPGVVVLAAAGRNGPGVGMLRASGNGTYLSWRAPGSDRFGSTVICTTDGSSYLLEDGKHLDKWLRVKVHSDYLNPGSADARVYLADVYNNGVGHDDLSAGEATAGNVEDYTITMANDNPMDVLNVRAWLEAETSWKVEISDDDIAYISPTAEHHVDTLARARIAAGATATLYLRRTIIAGAGSDPGVLNHLQFAFDSI
jgi:hypothetical protein